MSKPESIMIDDVRYVRSDVSQKSECLDGMPYQIVRTYSAGCFAGYVKSRNGQEVVMTKARRLWQWYGAMSLSELAVNGTTQPNDCKFAVEVDITLINAIEIIETTKKAKDSIQGVKVWK